MTAELKNIRKHSLKAAIFDLEDDMRQVKDWALILNDFMSDRGHLDEERRGALVRVTGQLLAIGYRLDAAFDILFDLSNKEAGHEAA